MKRLILALVAMAVATGAHAQTTNCQVTAPGQWGCTQHPTINFGALQTPDFFAAALEGQQAGEAARQEREAAAAALQAQQAQAAQVQQVEEDRMVRAQVGTFLSQGRCDDAKAVALQAGQIELANQAAQYCNASKPAPAP